MQNTKPYILLVEDTPFASKLAASVLTELNCAVDIAESGERALEMVAQKKYDLIFMDLGLPKMDGVAATEEIKKMAGMADIPIIALTAHAEEEMKQKCFNAGMVDYMVKPLEKKNADDVLKKYLLAR